MKQLIRKIKNFFSLIKILINISDKIKFDAKENKIILTDLNVIFTKDVTIQSLQNIMIKSNYSKIDTNTNKPYSILLNSDYVTEENINECNLHIRSDNTSKIESNI